MNISEAKNAISNFLDLERSNICYDFDNLTQYEHDDNTVQIIAKLCEFYFQLNPPQFDFKNNKKVLVSSLIHNLETLLQLINEENYDKIKTLYTETIQD
jgi:hypothetical protein